MATPRDASSDRLDAVLFGASGFVGRLTAAYLAATAPTGFRWALAGRSHDKLAALRDELTAIDPGLADLPLRTADVSDAAALRTLAAETRVLATTVGPYVTYGDAVVGACAAAGTDYLDLTGEPEFVDETYVRHHQVAVSSGARLVHAAGFDSVPHDLGALFTVNRLATDEPVRMSGYVRASAMASGGTLASLLTAFSRPVQNVGAARRRRTLERADVPHDGRRVRSVVGVPHRDPVSGGYAVPLPSLDPQIVTRSARALPRYGPDFRYSHFASLPRLRTAAGGAAGLVALAAAAQVPPAREAIGRRLAPGEGPSEAKRANSWFTVSFVAEARDGARVRTRVSGGDPGYDETAKMLGESMLCLALDDGLPDVAGQVTTAQAMGDALIGRLQAAGIGFELLP